MYLLTDEFPAHERYGLASQMQQAAVSIPSNIAEGYMRQSNKEYKQFLSLSLGSAAELETQLIICHDLPYKNIVPTDNVESLIEEIIKMLRAMISRLPNVA